MTLPDERYRAVTSARELLTEIATPGGKWKRVPKQLRLYASYCLKHYPNDWDMKQAAQACPEVFQKEMEPLTRMFSQYKIEQKEEQHGN